MNAKEIGFSIFAVFVALGLIGGGCYFVPQYGVYQQGLEGVAKLKEAESSRQIAVEEAKAKLESAKMLAAAEIERAKGVAEANKIIGESLKANEEYLRYLWVNNLHEAVEAGTQVIYVPTEAGLPILESGKRKEINKQEAKPE